MSRFAPLLCLLLACQRPNLDIGADDWPDLSSSDLGGPELFATPSDLLSPPDLLSVPDLVSAPDLSSAPDLQPADCTPMAPEAEQFVDPVLGTDDVSHGGGPGACAYRTLTFALLVAEGPISLAKAVYETPDEIPPYRLRSSQALRCNGATLKGKNLTTHVIKLDGDANRLDNCIVDGTNTGNTCVWVNHDAAVAHVIESSTLQHCGGTAAYVTADGVELRNTRFSDAPTDAILWYGTRGTMAGNTFSGNVRDINCLGTSSTDIAGSGNTRAGGAPTCFGCAACPF